MLLMLCSFRNGEEWGVLLMLLMLMPVVGSHVLGWRRLGQGLVVAHVVVHVPGGDVAQLVEHRTGTPPTQVRFPGAKRDFSPTVNFQCDSLTVSVHPRAQ